VRKVAWGEVWKKTTKGTITRPERTISGRGEVRQSAWLTGEDSKRESNALMELSGPESEQVNLPGDSSPQDTLKESEESSVENIEKLLDEIRLLTG